MVDKIMVVDDEQDTVELANVVLKLKGFESIGFTEPKKALAELKAGLRPDLIILDMRMPLMSGPEFCEEVRKDANLKGIKIVYFTASSEKDDPKMKLHKVLGVIFKPFNNDDLIKEVKKYLDA